MNTFYGVIGFNNSKVDVLFGDLKKNVSATELEHETSWLSENAALGFIENIIGANSVEDPPESKQGLNIVSDSRIDYREELGFKMNLPAIVIQKMSDSQLILESYQFWGVNCTKHLYGDFSFAIWDEKLKKLFCARDHFGLRPFYYAIDEGLFFFSNEIEVLINNDAIKKSIKDQVIIDSLMGLSSPKDESGYDGIRKLKPANNLVYSSDGNPKVIPYWDLRNTKEIKAVQEDEASGTINKLFTNAVEQRLKSDGPVGFELSGGLDSSSISSIGAKLLKNQMNSVNVFSQVLPEKQENIYYPFKDESKYGKSIIEYRGITNVHRITCEKSGALEAIEKQVLTNIATVGQTVPFMMDKLYENASYQGVNIMLSGFGGDEGVTSRANGFFEELVSKREWRYLKEQLRIKASLKGRNYSRSILKYYVFRISKYSFPLLRKLQIFPDYRRGFYKNVLLDKKVREKFKTKRRFMSLGKVRHDCFLRERQYHTIMHNHICDRIENTYHLAKSHQVEYRYPFLDVKLVEYYFSLPAVLKYRNGYGRYIFRKAMEKELPSEICWRTDKSGASVPNSLYRFLFDKESFKEIIEEGRLNNQYHYVDYSKTMTMLEDLIALSKGKNMGFGPRLFYSTIRVLLMQKWQREGKIDIGIKC